MFEFTVPEPAAFYLWSLTQQQDSTVALPFLEAPDFGPGGILRGRRDGEGDAARRLHHPRGQGPLAGRGFRTQDGINFAFKTGTPVRIPFQKIELYQYSVAYLERVWWQAVLDVGDLRELRELFREWRGDATKVPFRLGFSFARHAFDVTTPEGLRTMPTHAFPQVLRDRFPCLCHRPPPSVECSRAREEREP